MEKYSEKRQQIEKKNAWIDEFCISRADLAKEVGLHPSSVLNRMKQLGVEIHKKKIYVDGRVNICSYIAKSDIELIKNFKGKNYKAERPEGFLTKEECAEYLQVDVSSVTSKFQKIKEKTGVWPVERRYIPAVKDGNVAMHVFYRKEDVKKVFENNRFYKLTCKYCNSEFKRAKKTLFCKPKCEKRHFEAEKGWIRAVDAVKEIGCPSRWRQLGEKTFKHEGSLYIKQESLQALKWEWKEWQERPRVQRVYRLSEEYHTWQEREKRVIEKFPEKIKQYEAKHGADSYKFKSICRAIDTVYTQHGLLNTTGELTMLTCNTCKEEKPFYDYPFDARSPKTGRRKHCRVCLKEYHRKICPPERSRKIRQENYVTRLKNNITKAIRGHIERTLHQAFRISNSEAWEAIEKHCGYNADDLVAHLEAQFTSNMNWFNQKTPKKPGEFGWHLDHIVPQAKFKYKSVDDPGFAACWALKNLRPLEAIMNMQKGDKKLYVRLQSSFRKGIEEARKGNSYLKGIWIHLDYTNLHAKKILEKKFAALPGLDWSNWGPEWHLDHINPSAHLAYVSTKCENFKKCWKLENLQPLSRKDNLCKGSLWDNKIWFHNC